ncbi:MAG TPA: patatin-like phospholipase family protein [Polyangiaceae bacterium]|nr:patatin-like phospholipase family protein [Polyangiaceae bacterium]
MRALVLSGGGAKGAYQVGAIKRWLSAPDAADYDVVCGCSVGAINGALLAQFKKGDVKAAIEHLEGVWSRVDNGKVRRCWLPFGPISALWKSSVYDSRPLQNWIRSELDVKKIAESGRKLRVVAVSWNSSEVNVVTESEPQLVDWVIGSSALPIMLNPITIGDQMWTDGGLRSVTPLGEAIRLNATEIDVIMCSDPFAPSPFDPNGRAAIPGLLIRSLDIQSDQIMRADLQICGLKNDLAGTDPALRKVKLRLLQPSQWLGETLDFSPEAIKKRMALGYEDAASAIVASSSTEVRAFVKHRRGDAAAP